MLAVYAASERALERLRPRLPDGERALLTADWETFLADAGEADCGIAVADGTDAALFSRLPAWEAHYPETPLVLLVRPSRRTLSRLAGLPVAEVIPRDCTAEELAAAVRRARSSRFLEGAAAAIEEAETLPPALRAALVHGCRSRPPVRTAERLTEAAGVTLRTLQRQLRKVAGLPSGLTPKVFQEWTVTLRAAPRGVTATWEAAAGEIGYSPEALREVIRRRTGKLPSDLGPTDLPSLRRRFEEEVLRPLLGTPPRGGD